MKVYYDSEPDKITYEALPDGTAHVLLRQNIKEITVNSQDGEENTSYQAWEADETELTTTLSKSDVESKFTSLILSNGPKPSIEERVSDIEEYLISLAEKEDS